MKVIDEKTSLNKHSGLCFYYKVNSLKVSDIERFKRQVNLACMRIKDKTGYQGAFYISKALKDNDFVEDKITVRIKTDRLI